MEEIVETLLNWYDGHARVLPWREDPTPYRVWISEIMLQQTRVETVKPYFERFLAHFPDLETLAAAPEELLLKCWEGLGYYQRVRNLQRAAQAIRRDHRGIFPADPAALLALPGIGDYTAGAIASIAFGRPEPAVDGNVLRVLARLTENPAAIDRPGTRRDFTGQLRRIYPTDRPCDFTQSLMELGALVCLPGTPKCGLCPLSSYCLTFQHGTTGSYPVKTPKKRRPVELRTVLLLTAKDRVALRRRPATGLLAGLMEFPSVEGRLDRTQLETLLREWGVAAGAVAPGPAARHMFTHREWDMQSWRIACAETAEPFIWVTRGELAAAHALPSAFKPFLRSL